MKAVFAFQKAISSYVTVGGLKVLALSELPLLIFLYSFCSSAAAIEVSDDHFCTRNP